MHTGLQALGTLRSENSLLSEMHRQKGSYERASVNQERVEEAAVLIVVCANTSRSVGRYGQRGKDFYSVIDGAFSSMLILLTAANEGLGAGFVAALEDERVSNILGLPEYVRAIGIIALGYADEEPERSGRIAINKLVHYERCSLPTI